MSRRGYDYNSPAEERATGYLASLHDRSIEIDKQIHDGPPWPDWHVGEFARDGVRCNGNQEPTTVQDIRRKLKYHKKSLRGYLQEVRKAYLEISALSKKAESVMRKQGLQVCRRCKGTKGSGESGRGTWEDCVYCGGAGVVPQRKKTPRRLP